MKYVEKTFKFIGKFYLLVIPLYILAAIPALINYIVVNGSLGGIFGSFSSMDNLFNQFDNPYEMFRSLSSLFFVASAASFIALALRFLVMPVTYGLVNKALQTGQGDLNDFSEAFSQNIGKYALYWLLNLAIWIVFMIAAFIIILILALLTAVIKWFGVFLLFIAIMAMIVAALVVITITSLWFASMVVDDFDVTKALKKSIELARKDFWMILAVIVVVAIEGGIAGGILSFFGVIPVIGTLILSVIPATTEFFMVIFYLMFYRDKTEKSVSVV